MRAAVLADVGRLEIRDVPVTPPGPGEVLLRVAAVGLCGTDFHIYGGHGNYHTDQAGRPIPLSVSPQILGHELVGVVSEVGTGVVDLAVGDRVIADQGRNCVSAGRLPLCEYCATGDSHQCAQYAEHGITGLPGALAECITLPAANALKVETELPTDDLALAEPLGCVVHSTDLLLKSATRFRLRDVDPVHRVDTIVIFGGGPAGLLFTQYLRSSLGFEGVIVLSDPNPLKRSLAAAMGATTLDPIAEDLTAFVSEQSSGRRAELIIDASGAGAVFRDMPRLLRKQGTVLLYGHGHAGVDMSALNNLQFLEPTLLSPVGASGGFEPDGRPSTYRRALGLLETGKVQVGSFITHRYGSLDEVPAAFAGAHEALDYVKGVVLLT
jgi:threonine dehydrogenase-like Zn-dependent dehydrogenase